MKDKSKTVVAVFQENGSGSHKTAGIIRYGGDNIELIHVQDVEGPLPEIIDEPEEYITMGQAAEADLVLDFLKHPDLAAYLVEQCNKRQIPVISSGKRIPGAITPFT